MPVKCIACKSTIEDSEDVYHAVISGRFGRVCESCDSCFNHAQGTGDTYVKDNAITYEDENAAAACRSLGIVVGFD